MSNLIVFLFNHFPVFFVEFNVRVVCGRLVKFYEEEEFATSSWLARKCQPMKGYMRSTCRNLKSLFARLDFASHFATQAKLWVTRETLYLELFDCSFSYTFTNIVYAFITHEIVRSFSKKLLREKTLAKHLRVRDCIPIIIYTIFLKFFFTPSSPSTHPWEVFSPNTYFTQFECWEKFWCIW